MTSYDSPDASTIADAYRDVVTELPPKIEDEAPKKSKSISSRKTALKLRLTGALGVIGKALSAFNEYDGKIVLENATELADALDQWARESPRVKKALEAALTVSTTGSVLGVAAAILIPILANHGLVPFHYAEVIGAEPVPNPERFHRPEPEEERPEFVDISVKDIMESNVETVERFGS
jgi:hypothetical protein